MKVRFCEVLWAPHYRSKRNRGTVGRVQVARMGLGRGCGRQRKQMEPGGGEGGGRGLVGGSVLADNANS